MQVLIAEDSKTTRSVIRRTLSLAGIEPGQVREAEDGAAALRAIEANAPDLLLTDIHMPNLDGVELIRAVRQRDLAPEMAIVVVSSNLNETRLSELQALGVQGCLPKPFTPEDLVEAVRHALGEELATISTGGDDGGAF